MRNLVTMVVAVLAFACGGVVGEPTVEALQQQASAQSSAQAKDKACGEPFKGPSWGTTQIDISDVQTTGFIHNVFTGPAILSGLGLSQIVFTHEQFFPDKSVTGSMTITAANGDALLADVVGWAFPDPDGSGGFILDQDGTFTGGTGRFAGAEGSFKVLGKGDGPSTDPGADYWLRNVRVTIDGYLVRNRECH
jgi:hypothetical protein